MGDTHVSNGTPGRVFVQNFVFDNNSITPSSTIGDNNINLSTDPTNSVNINQLSVSHDSNNSAVIMETSVQDEHIVIRSSGNGNIYLGNVNNTSSVNDLSFIGTTIRSNIYDGTVFIDPNGPSGTVNIYNQLYVSSGNVGIGTNAPNAKFHVVGNIKLTGLILDSNGDPYVIPTWSKSGNDLYYSDGNVIVGSSSSPSGKFDIIASSGRGLIMSGDAGTTVPQASFSGSSNTMLLRAGNSDSNNYTFSVEKSDSSNVLRVGNDGLVGIGNTTPSYGLDVAVSARMNHSLIVGGTGLTASVDGESVKLVGVSSSYIGLYPDSPSLRKGYFGYDEGVLKFDSESSSRHFNFASGHVGLKTLTPNYDLTINAGSTDSTLSHGNHHAFGIVGSTDQETLLMGYDAVVDAGYFNVSNVDGAVPLLLQTLGGSVGIGSNSPLGRLDVRKGTASISGWEAASFGAETSANDLVVVGNYNNRAVIAGKNATMSADANLVFAPTGGNVGVGAMSPAYKLDIDGSINLTGNLYRNGSLVAVSNFFQNGGNVYLNNTNFGIGTSSPSFKLDVDGDINFTGTLYENGSPFITSQWTTSGSNIYYSSGNVGIGTTSPGAPLQIDTTAYVGAHIKRTSNGGSVMRFETTQGSGYVDIGVDNVAPNLFMAVGGSTRFYIESSTGNVGIGTSTPVANLDIAGSHVNNKGLQLRSGDTLTGTDSSQIIFSFNNGSYDNIGYSHSIRTRHNNSGSSGNAIDFWLWDHSVDTSSTLGSLRVMTLDGTGNVGIGISSPDTKLHIYDSSSSTAIFLGEDGTTDKSGIIKYLQGNGSGTGFMVIGNWGDELDNSGTGIVVKKGGNVGVGTISPSSKLTIVPTGTQAGLRVSGEAGTSFPQVKFENSTFGLSVETNNTSSSYYALSIANSSTTLMRIRNDGYVGIGTTSPDRDFVVSKNTSSYIKTVNTSSNNYIMLGAGGSSSGTFLYSRQTDETTPVKFSINQGSLGSTFVIDTSGNVGIGTSSPSQKLHVDGAIRVTSNPSNPGDNMSASFWNQTNVGPTISGASFSVQTNGTSERLRISNNGYVGIGTSSPDSLLHVVGSTSGTGTEPNAIVHIKQNTAWSGNEPWALYVEGYSHMSGFRINGADGERAVYLESGSGTQFGFATEGNWPITFSQNASDRRMTIAAGGNVGIGTSSPDRKLVVSDNTSCYIKAHNTSNDNTIVIGADSTQARLYARKNQSTTPIAFSVHQGSLGDTLVLNTSGNAGIGTNSPSSKLHVFSSASGEPLGYFQSNGDASIRLNGQGGEAYIEYMNQHTTTSNAWKSGVNDTNKFELSYGTPGTANSSLYGMTLDTSGNVGINTLLPMSGSNLLGIHINQGTHAALVLGNPISSTYGGYIQTSDSKHRVFIGANIRDDPTNSWTQTTTGKGYAGISVLGDANDWGSNIQFWASNSDHTSSTSLQVRMVVSGNGNVGIGTISPSYKLHVAGDINYTGNLYKNGTLVSSGSGGLWSANGSNIYFSGGKVGIGTTTPESELQVMGDISVDAYDQGEGHGIFFRRGTTSTVGDGTYNMSITSRGFGTSNTPDGLLISGQDGIGFATAISNTYDSNYLRMVILNGGNVGIGTSSPEGNLHISDTGDCVVIVEADTDNSSGESDNPAIWFRQDGGLNEGAITMDSNRLILVNNVTPNGGIAFFTGTTNNTGTDSPLTGATEKMTIVPSGNVGIGTTTPYAKLHITGGGDGNISLTSGTRNYFRYNMGLYSNTAGWGMGGTSLYASADIVSSSEIASHSSTTFSDTRIKKDIVDIDDDSALQTIRLIKPKKYSYVDTVSRGSEQVWGFIAQEVKSTLDYAVSLMEKAIPNIYCLGNVLDNGNIIEISNFNTANLQHKDDGTLITKLQLKSWDNQEIEVEINSVLSSSRIRLTKPLEENVCNGTIGDEIIENQVFVYGQYVDDFHVLKKDAIFTVGIAALQEVDRRQVADNERILELEGEVSVLQSELSTTRTELSTARTELDEAKDQIASMQAQIDSILARIA